MQELRLKIFQQNLIGKQVNVLQHNYVECTGELLELSISSDLQFITVRQDCKHGRKITKDARIYLKNIKSIDKVYIF